MMNKFWSGTAMVAAMQVVLVVGAQAKTDPMRCEAKNLRCESTFFTCLARCSRQFEAQQAKMGDAANARNASCIGACEFQYSVRTAQINVKPPCQEIVATPNPFECRAHYLRAESTYMICQASCQGGAHQDDCTAACTLSYQTKLDQVKAEPVCKNGPATMATTPGQ